MSDEENHHWVEGVVRAESYAHDTAGKQFLGAAIECADGTVWIIDYGELSPFHALADRQVTASGEPYEPTGQAIIGWNGRSGKMVRHFHVSTMRPLEVTSDVQIVEIRASQQMSGRFERDRAIGGSTLSFATDDGRRFSVFNDPPGVVLRANVEVAAYPIKLAPPFRGLDGECVWIECPCSSADLWDWRKRRMVKPRVWIQ